MPHKSAPRPILNCIPYIATNRRLTVRLLVLTQFQLDVKGFKGSMQSLSLLCQQTNAARIQTLLLVLFIALCPSLATPAHAQSAAPNKSSSKLHGGIEIGSKGVKATAINFTRKGSSYDVKLLYSETINTTIMKVKDNRFTPEALKETALAVQKIYTRLQQEYQVPVEHIYVIGSSGLRAENKQDLVTEIRAITGKNLSFLTVEMEVQLSIAGTIPARRDDLLTVNERDAAMLIDIGSGNTKGGFQQAAPAPVTDVPVASFVTMGIPLGTVTFTNEAARQISDEKELRAFALNAATLSPKLLNTPLRKEIEKQPGLLTRQRVYLTGGIVWAMTTLMHPENRRAFVPLTVNDIDLFQHYTRNEMDTLLNPDLSYISDELKRQEIKKEIEAVKAAFTPRNLMAGAEILKAVATEFQLENKKLWFARFGHLSWILSYVRGQAEKQMLAAEAAGPSATK